MSSLIRMTGLVSGLDTESIVKELMSAQRMKETKIQNQKTELEWKQDKWKDLNSKIYSFYTASLAKMKMQGAYNTKQASSSNEAKATATAGVQAPEGTHTIEVSSVASAEYITGSQLTATPAITYSTTLSSLGLSDGTTYTGTQIKIVGDKEVTMDIVRDKTTVGDFVAALQSAGLNASFDTTQQRFFISSKNSGVKNAFSVVSTSNKVGLSKLGLAEITGDKTTGSVNLVYDDPTDPNVKVTAVNASDAVIMYNKAKITSSTNSIAVNGLTINVKDKTASNEVINITVSRDNQAIYDSIKSFLKSYNDVLKTLNEDYDAATAKGYTPLTDDQKKAMTDTEVEKWENKIKDSLLRRDTTLESIISGMRGLSQEGIQVNGKNYALSSFGITSVVYTEKGQLHIDGDKDDAVTSGNDDKLMKAITENPDAVMDVFTTLTGKLYSTMTDQMKSTTLRSALTFYNDKEMKKQVSDYDDEISDMESKLSDMEDRYYKQFTAMETAMANMKAQQSSLSSLLGTNTSN